MSVEIQWTDVCPRTGEKRFVVAERFAREWTFKVRYKRREDWQKNAPPTREMWRNFLTQSSAGFPAAKGWTTATLPM